MCPFCKRCSFIWLIWDRGDHSTINYWLWDAPSRYLLVVSRNNHKKEACHPTAAVFWPFFLTLPPVSHLIGGLVFIYLHLGWGEGMVLFTVRNIMRLDKGGGVANVGCVWLGGKGAFERLLDSLFPQTPNYSETFFHRLIVSADNGS